MKNIETKYPEYIMNKVRQNLGLEDGTDTSMDPKIESMSSNEVFKRVLNWEGIIGYDSNILSWIKAIYGVDVENVNNGHGIFAIYIESEYVRDVQVAERPYIEHLDEDTGDDRRWTDWNKATLYVGEFGAKTEEDAIKKAADEHGLDTSVLFAVRMV